MPVVLLGSKPCALVLALLTLSTDNLTLLI
nr:MAG TPA: hypothetical protein [Caudoviricetes sp.]